MDLTAFAGGRVMCGEGGLELRGDAGEVDQEGRHDVFTSSGWSKVLANWL